MKKITLTVGALALAVLIDARPSQGQAYEGPWCAWQRGGDGAYATRCDLTTYEACRAWINASPGTWCTENPRYRGPVGQPGRTNRQRAR